MKRKSIDNFSATFEKIDLKRVNGGDSGITTDTYKCTEKDFGFGQSAGDTYEDGDFISTC